MYDEKPRPSRNTELIKLYELLHALATSLPSTIATLSLRDGTGERFNSYIDEIISITHDNRLNDFKTRRYQVHSRIYTSGEEYSRQLIGALHYLHQVDETLNYYCETPPVLKSNEGSQPTINNQMSTQQNVNQSTNVEIEIRQTMLQLSDQLSEIERAHPDESSKENQFAKKLKEILPTLNGSLDLVSKILKVAAQVGISPQVALKLLGLN